MDDEGRLASNPLVHLGRRPQLGSSEVRREAHHTRVASLEGGSEPARRQGRSDTLLCVLIVLGSAGAVDGLDRLVTEQEVEEVGPERARRSS